MEEVPLNPNPLQEHLFWERPTWGPSPKVKALADNYLLSFVASILLFKNGLLFALQRFYCRALLIH
jgi:hypothetical protein